MNAHGPGNNTRRHWGWVLPALVLTAFILGGRYVDRMRREELSRFPADGYIWAEESQIVTLGSTVTVSLDTSGHPSKVNFLLLALAKAGVETSNVYSVIKLDDEVVSLLGTPSPFIPFQSTYILGPIDRPGFQVSINGGLAETAPTTDLDTLRTMLGKAQYVKVVHAKGKELIRVTPKVNYVQE